MHEEQQGELLWRHIVDVKYDGRADLDGTLARAESTSQDLRELSALAEDVHRSLNDDPAYAQAAARSRLLNLIYADMASDSTSRRKPQRWKLFRIRFGLGSRPAMVIALIFLMTTAMAAWTAIAIQQWNECCRPPTAGSAASSAAGSDGQPGFSISVRDELHRSRQNRPRQPQAR